LFFQAMHANGQPFNGTNNSLILHRGPRHSVFIQTE